MSPIVAPGKDFTITFLNWHSILFSSIPDTMESPTLSLVFLLHLWWILFLVPLSDCSSCCLVALNTVWYCWWISFSWWSNLASLICSCCYCWSAQVINCFFLNWLLTSSLAVLQFWKFSIFSFVEVSEASAVNCFLLPLKEQFFYTIVAIFHWWWEKWKEENTRGSSHAFKKRSATTRLCNTLANQVIILMLDKRKSINTTKTK